MHWTIRSRFSSPILSPQLLYLDSVLCHAIRSLVLSCPLCHTLHLPRHVHPVYQSSHTLVTLNSVYLICSTPSKPSASSPAFLLSRYARASHHSPHSLPYTHFYQHTHYPPSIAIASVLHLRIMRSHVQPFKTCNSLYVSAEEWRGKEYKSIVWRIT